MTIFLFVLTFSRIKRLWIRERWVYINICDAYKPENVWWYVFSPSNLQTKKNSIDPKLQQSSNLHVNLSLYYYIICNHMNPFEPFPACLTLFVSVQSRTNQNLQFHQILHIKLDCCMTGKENTSDFPMNNVNIWKVGANILEMIQCYKEKNVIGVHTLKNTGVIHRFPLTYIRVFEVYWIFIHEIYLVPCVCVFVSSPMLDNSSVSFLLHTAADREPARIQCRRVFFAYLLSVF